MRPVAVHKIPPPINSIENVQSQVASNHCDFYKPIHILSKMVAQQAKCILVCIVMSLASGISARSLEWRELSDLSMEPGDKIQCRTSSWPNYHWLLATENDRLIHIVGSPYVDNAVVVREQYLHYAFRQCRNHGPGPAGRNAVQNARQMKGESLYYDMMTCNCEHYVRYWAGGNYNQTQSGHRASESCGILQYSRYTSPPVDSSEEDEWL